MSTPASPAPERVFPATPPAAPSPAAGGSSKNPLAALKGTNRKTLLAGAAAVTVLLALTVGRRDAGATDDEEVDGNGPYTLDTRAEDIDQRLNELENAIGDRPRPATPVQPSAGTPTGPNPGPVRGGTAPSVGRYRVKAGDTLTSVAKAKKVRGGAARLYAWNRETIREAARKNGHKSPWQARRLYAGTVLVLPSK